MYCPECGKALSENQKFCSECGTPVSSAVTSEANCASEMEPEKAVSEFAEYLDQYIRQKTTFTSVSSLINGAQPLRFRRIITVVLCSLGFLTMNFAGIIIGLLVSILVCRVTLLLLLAKRSNQKYSTNGISVNLNDLTPFLEQNLDQRYFSAWQRGTPTVFGIAAPDLLTIECLFHNKTYHRITFDTSTNGTYRIEPHRASTKERLKDGGDRNPAVLYKSDWIVRPILEAALAYYLNMIKN